MIVRRPGQLIGALVVMADLGQAGRCSRSGDELPAEAVARTVTLDGQPLLTAEFMKGGGNEQLTFSVLSD